MNLSVQNGLVTTPSVCCKLHALSTPRTVPVSHPAFHIMPFPPVYFTSTAPHMQCCSKDCNITSSPHRRLLLLVQPCHDTNAHSHYTNAPCPDTNAPCCHTTTPCHDTNTHCHDTNSPPHNKSASCHDTNSPCHNTYTHYHHTNSPCCDTNAPRLPRRTSIGVPN